MQIIKWFSKYPVSEPRRKAENILKGGGEGREHKIIGTEGAVIGTV